jgi:prepilin-type N-terminal cleavage/methylation domain-containing protein
MKTKRGFTIVEMLVVMGIISILIGIVTTAASSSIKQARTRKADACCTLVQQALSTYYAQYGKWPGSIGSRIANGISARTNDEGGDGQTDADKYVLDASEIDDMIKTIVLETKKGNPMMDISGLYVSRYSGEKTDKYRGMDFIDAVRGTKQSRKKMKVAEMHFGYPETDHGWFRRFKVVYSITTDEMKVSKQ